MGINKLVLTLTLIYVALTKYDNVSAQKVIDQEVPTDYALAIGQGEKELQLDPQASKVSEIIKKSETIAAFENGLETPVKILIIHSESTQSVKELEPTLILNSVNSNVNSPFPTVEPSVDNIKTEQITLTPTNTSSFTFENIQPINTENNTNAQSGKAIPSEVPLPSITTPEQTVVELTQDTPSSLIMETPTVTPEQVPTKDVQGVKIEPNIFSKFIINLKLLYSFYFN